MLQTELFIVRALSSCMDAHWRYHHQRNLRTTPVEPVDPEEASFQKPWPSPPGVEEPLAKFILSTMMLLMRMTTYEVSSTVASSPGYTGPPAGSYMTKGESNHPSAGRSIIRYLHAGNGDGQTDLGFRYRGPQDLRHFTSTPSNLNGGESGSVMKDNVSTILSEPMFQRGHRKNISTDSTGGYSTGNSPASGLLYEISRTVGKIIYFLSSSSWAVIFARVRNRLLYLSSATEEHPDAIELRLLDWCNIDQAKLVLVIRGESNQWCTCPAMCADNSSLLRIHDAFPPHEAFRTACGCPCCRIGHHELGRVSSARIRQPVESRQTA
jgi:neurofibromin 1